MLNLEKKMNILDLQKINKNMGIVHENTIENTISNRDFTDSEEESDYHSSKENKNDKSFKD